SVFPSDLSENNTSLLSFKSISYQTDKILNGQIVSIPVSDAQKPLVVTSIVPKIIKNKNFLSNLLEETNITYGDYYYPTQSVQNINNGFAITTTTFQYHHNPSGVSGNYYMGRKSQEITTTQAYGDTKSIKEDYTYLNNLL